MAARASASIIVPPEGLGTSWSRGPTTCWPPMTRAVAGSVPSLQTAPVQRIQTPEILFQASRPGTGATNRQPPDVHLPTPQDQLLDLGLLRLGRQQLQIMRILWERGRATARRWSRVTSSG